MSIIHSLSEDVCNRIAAGEVVERPSSVVKELVENSIDAGATRIRVLVEDAGKKQISVIDNGCGMDEDDAQLCFDSHATSKIRSEEDIYAINSFGFRGEAIPSIASVARVTVRTRQKESSSGFEVTVHGGKFISANPAGCAPGTEVIVRDLFFKQPARKKFLKSASTEEHHIIEIMMNIALAHTDIAFELKLNGRNVLLTAAGSDLIQRVREIFGKAYTEHLVPVATEDVTSPVQVTGFISTRADLKNTRAEQRVFVNGRPVDALQVYQGIRDGYGPILEKGRYPIALLFLTVPVSFVDVNVHPAKREVRFQDNFAIVNAVRSAVTAALRNADPVLPAPQDQAGTDVLPSRRTYVPESFGSDKDGGSGRLVQSLYPDFSPGSIKSPESVSELEIILKKALVDYHVAGTAQSSPELRTLADFFKNGATQPTETVSSDETQREQSQPTGENLSLEQQTVPVVRQEPAVLPFAEENLRDFPSAGVSEDKMFFNTYKMKILGVMENSYIIGVIANGLVLIDQHAAHERVLFEKILRHTDASRSQKLLFPITLELSRSDLHFVTANLSEFEKAGFEIEPFGAQTVKLNAIPAALPQDNAGGIFQDMLARIAAEGTAQSLQIHQIATAACKAAVKAHDHLSPAECDALIRELAECELPFSCPHGRPTVLNISLNEIERRFGRK